MPLRNIAESRRGVIVLFLLAGTVLLVPTFLCGCQKNARMTLISNQENTSFELRKLAEKDWTGIGKGKILYVDVPNGEPFEVAAKPQGYIRKVHSLTNPVRELRFTFEISDRIGAKRMPFFEVDVRIVDVRTARTIATANGRTNGTEDLRASVEAVALDLLSSGKLSGTVAVVPFTQTGASDVGRYGEAAGNMMMSALEGEQRGFVLIERAQLSRILAEHDLSLAAVANNPDLLGRVSGVQFAILGSVALME